MANFKSIEPELCNLCGTCVGVCPNGCIKLADEKLRFNDEKCINCSLCYNSCPGISVDFDAAEKSIFKGGKKSELIGFYNGIYIGRANKQDIISGSSSGGVVTGILLSLLNRKLIDGVIVVGNDPTNPFLPKVIIAKTEKDLLDAQGSKYTLVPLNAILKQIKDAKGSYAMVGLPCHIHGIRKLQLTNHKDAMKIKYIIGIFCGFNVSYDATEFFMKKLGVKKDDIKSLKYRAGDWPGGFEIITKSKERKFLPKYYYDITDATFVPKRCLVCIDYMSELADISVGDIYMGELKRQKWSTVISRTDIGKKIIDMTSDAIEYRPLDKEKLMISHSHNIKHKKKGAIFRIQLRKKKPLYKLSDGSVIGDNKSKRSFTFKEKFSLGVMSTVFAVTRTRIFRFFLSLVPLKLLGKAAYLRRKMAKKTT